MLHHLLHPWLSCLFLSEIYSYSSIIWIFRSSRNHLRVVDLTLWSHIMWGLLQMAIETVNVIPCNRFVFTIHFLWTNGFWFFYGPTVIFTLKYGYGYFLWRVLFWTCSFVLNRYQNRNLNCMYPYIVEDFNWILQSQFCCTPLLCIFVISTSGECWDTDC